jgi:hypothetical protein
VGCDGSGINVIGGDAVQGYSMECPGCKDCQPEGTIPSKG